MDFKLVKSWDREALEEWSTWGQYYEPGDINQLAKCGYDREAVRAAIKAVGWSDDYWFPIPDGTAQGAFQFEYRRTLFRTPDGVEISGFVCNEGHAIGLFGSADVWMINENLFDMYEEQRAAIFKDLQLAPQSVLLPLEFELAALGGRNFFPRR